MVPRLQESFWARSGKQQQEQNWPNLGTTIWHTFASRRYIYLSLFFATSVLPSNRTRREAANWLLLSKGISLNASKGDLRCGSNLQRCLPYEAVPKAFAAKYCIKRKVGCGRFRSFLTLLIYLDVRGSKSWKSLFEAYSMVFSIRTLSVKKC